MSSQVSNEDLLKLLNKLADLSKEHNEIADKLRNTHNEYLELHEQFEAAFPKNDEKQLDLAGHKQFHKDQIKRDEDSAAAKSSTKRAVTTWVTIGLLTILLNVVWDKFLKPLIDLASSSQ